MEQHFNCICCPMSFTDSQSRYEHEKDCLATTQRRVEQEIAYERKYGRPEKAATAAR